MTEQERSLQKREEVGSFSLSFGEKIRTARKAADLSQTALGERLASAMDRSGPFSQSYISDLERKNLKIDPHIANALSAILETSVIDSPTTEGVFSGINPSRQRALFEERKDALGLPKEFPRLLPLRDEDLLTSFYVGKRREGMPEYILSQHGNVAVRMTRGHGVTTLARYVTELTRTATSESGLIPGGGLIPVYFGVDTIDKAQLDQNPRGLIETLIRDGILRRLREEGWSRLPNDMLDELKGKVQALSVPALIGLLMKMDYIDVRLHIDLSSRDYYNDFDKHAKTVATLQTGLNELRKELEEPLIYPTLTTVYFGDNRSLAVIENAIRTDGKQPFDEDISYPHYDYSDVIELLAIRYHPDITIARDIEFERNLADKRWIPNWKKEYTAVEAFTMVVPPILFNLITGSRPPLPLVETVRLLENRLISQT